ncbi:hypothetical protein H112_04830 [Trichophyton rubrum D6]|uniref:Uncharacterized protein n=3 Tax=Trichophyton TaxID=5550 RepID=A0A080WLE1_TRIRC|nr:uncharacterized protein TERG_12162 [Trichophyton rubrum CBS 118892]EZF22408.1 hypothetical protein H100_04843 [Trichophyton rubrum MR850]EZF41557.1 hypothetical protein H102_04827 [Trichophyton rubrum CBS 100081]EZF52129.1 hypothetical protein H103_04832 [Trichophyton rubrum CBS 288.86]EZF62593.1 hypothetical protein H104_04821 [Trichophyton rubrum CBS 289.86]EZF73242.1 hypothetical protein H105_04849 [Trichophyton soudanense CBS 452.61]EZF84034.1 hypothetical protein H110_04829 [Trichophy
MASIHILLMPGISSSTVYLTQHAFHSSWPMYTLLYAVGLSQLYAHRPEPGRSADDDDHLQVSQNHRLQHLYIFWPEFSQPASIPASVTLQAIRGFSISYGPLTIRVSIGIRGSVDF